jgi:type IV secretory pathway VirB2 component (pilin)
MSVQAPSENTGGVTAQVAPGTLPVASSPSSTPGTATQSQLDFAQAAFANGQELNRTMDQKANYILGAVALLTAALGLVVSRAIVATAEDDWQRLLKGTAIVLMLLYLVLAFVLVLIATNIYQARSHSRRVSATTTPGMLFPLMIVERFTVADKVDEAAYLEKLRTLRLDDALQDYANQIIEVSLIYKEKQQQVNFGLRLFRVVGALWLLAMLTALLASVLLP